MFLEKSKAEEEHKHRKKVEDSNKDHKDEVGKLKNYVKSLQFELDAERNSMSA